MPHRTLRWSGSKPKTGLQETARPARYRSAGAAARARATARPDRPHARRSGRDRPVPPRARQRCHRARGHGVCGAASRRPARHDLVVRPLLDVAKAGWSRRSRPPACRSQRRSRATATRALPGRGCGRSCRRSRARARRALLSRLAARMRRAEATIEFAVVGRARRVGAGPVARARPDRVRRGAVQRPARGSRAAPARPRDRARRRRGAGRARQARGALPGAAAVALAAAPARLAGALSRCAAIGWWSSVLRRAARRPASEQPLYEIAVLITRIRSLPPLVRRALLLAVAPWVPTFAVDRDVKPPRFAATNASRRGSGGSPGKDMR